MINYVKDDDFVGFTRKENAREDLINNVPSVMVMSIVRNYLEEKNISYVSDYEVIEKYVKNVLGIIRNDNEKLEFNLDYIIEAIKNAYKNTKYKYNQGQAECALRHLLTDGNLLYFTNQFDDRTLLQNISSQYNLKDCIISYLGKEFIIF